MGILYSAVRILPHNPIQCQTSRLFKIGIIFINVRLTFAPAKLIWQTDPQPGEDHTEIFKIIALTLRVLSGQWWAGLSVSEAVQSVHIFVLISEKYGGLLWTVATSNQKSHGLGPEKKAASYGVGSVLGSDLLVQGRGACAHYANKPITKAPRRDNARLDALDGGMRPGMFKCETKMHVGIDSQAKAESRSGISSGYLYRLPYAESLWVPVSWILKTEFRTSTAYCQTRCCAAQRCRR